MTNGQSSRVIAASGTDRRIRLRRPAPAGTPPTAPGRQTPAAADRPRHGRRLRPRQINPGRSRQTPAAADRPRPPQTGPGHTTRFHACKKMLHVAPACRCAGQPSPGPATAQTNRRPRQSSLKPAITQTGRHSSRPSPKPAVAQAEPRPVLPPNPIAAPPAATLSDHCPGLPPLDRSPHKKTPRPRRDAAYQDADIGSPTPTRSLRAVWRRCRRLRG